MLIRLVRNAVFWLNAFPAADGVSNSLSPCYDLLTGCHLDFAKHVRTEFGAYVQTHEEHSNNMETHTLGAICLGPTGNEQGGHYFMSLDTGYLITCNPWTKLPMPNNVIRRVNRFGRDQDAPKSLPFGNRYGHELHDNPDDIDDDHDDNFHPDDDSAYDTDLDNDYLDDFDNEDPDNPDHHPDHVNEAALPAAPTGVNIVQNHEDEAR
jgi:hypothetical protein